MSPCVTVRFSAQELKGFSTTKVTGIVAEAVDANLYEWEVRFLNFDVTDPNERAIAKDLERSPGMRPGHRVGVCVCVFVCLCVCLCLRPWPSQREASRNHERQQ